MNDRRNDRRHLFVQEYLVDLNATRAAMRAGYSERSARQAGARLMSNAAICAEIVKAQTRAAAKVEITRELIINGLLARAGQDESHAAAVRAWEVIAKMCGHLVEKQAVEHSMAPDSEVLARAKAAIAVIEAKRDVEET